MFERSVIYAPRAEVLGWNPILPWVPIYHISKKLQRLTFTNNPSRKNSSTKIICSSRTRTCTLPYCKHKTLHKLHKLYSSFSKEPDLPQWVSVYITWIHFSLTVVILFLRLLKASRLNTTKAIHHQFLGGSLCPPTRTHHLQWFEDMLVFQACKWQHQKQGNF